MISRTLSILAIALTLASAQHASAHSIDIHVVPDGDLVRGRVTFAEDEPGANMTVIIFTEEGAPLTTVETDSDGRFTYQPEQRSPLRYIVETLDGHRAQQLVGLLAPEPSGSSMRDEAIELLASESDIVRVMEKLDLLERRTRTRDVFAGLGYIFGVMGLILFWKSRSSKASP